MEKNLFGIAAVISSVGFLIWSVGQATAFPQSPNVSLGSNPIVSFYCYSNNTYTYTVPAGVHLIITDISSLIGSGENFAIEADGIIVWRLRGSNTTPVQNLHFSSGIKIPEGTIVSCSGSNGAAGYLAGYLAHQ